MDERQEKSILEMGRGAIMERADYEMSAMIRNILDPNTSAKAARKLNITLTFKPGDDRQTIVMDCVATSKLASTNAVTTMLYVLDENTIVEMAPQIPGQMAVDIGEQETPPKLRLIKTAGWEIFMLKEFIEHIQKTTQPLITNVNGSTFRITSDGDVKEILPTIFHPDTLDLNSLDALVTMVRTEASEMDAPLYIAVPDCKTVCCFGQSRDYDERCFRQVYYEAHATDVPGWDQKVTLGFEEAQIALRTRFQETPDTVYAMKLVSDISLGAKVIYNDNGIATSVTTQKGVALQTNEQIRPLVKLRPYRTFQEVEQPESIFLIRVSDRGISFIEADGGMWRLTARETIKKYLEGRLEQEVSEGSVHVVL